MNPTAVTPELTHGVEELIRKGADVIRLLGPEHGLRGEAQDMISVRGGVDPLTRLPVVSLYGQDFASLSPRDDDLEGLDALVFDIQDVGSRYYTYVATLLLSMVSAARCGVEVIVLDRPNPIGGEQVEGPNLDRTYESFVGLVQVAARHGMTAGEIASLARKRWDLDLHLTVVECQQWQRSQYFDETGLPWVLPSPNMPTLDTAIVYPGMCLLEGTNISEGRGTTRPFELFGAPFLDARSLCNALDDHKLPGVTFRPVGFIPSFHKFQGQTCYGAQLHVTDRTHFRPFLTGVAILREITLLSDGRAKWRTEPYEFVSDRLAIDLLTGGSVVRSLIELGTDLETIAGSWQKEEAAFREDRQEFLLY